MAIPLTDKIVPLGDFPIVEDLYVEGGFRSVADEAARDAIPAGLLKEGMLVWARSEASLSQLLSGVWVPFATGGFTAGGDLSGTSTNQTVIGVQGRSVSGLGSNNTFLRTRSAAPSSIVDPNGIAWDGTYLWLGSYSSGTIYKIDPTDWSQPVLTLDLSTHSITGIAFIRVWGNYLLVGNGGLGTGDGKFAIIDWTTNAIVGLGDNGGGPTSGGSIVVGDTYDQIWMPGNLDAGVWYFALADVLSAFPSPDTGTVIATGLVTQVQAVVLGSDGNIWVGCGGLGNGAYLLEINPVAHTITDTRNDVALAGLVMLWSAFGSIWATQGGVSTDILRYDIASFPGAPTPITLTPSGSFPYFWDIVADGTYVYVPDDGDYGSVYVIDPDTDAQVGTITNGDSGVWCGPITWTGTSFWVSVQDTIQGIAEITYTPNVFGTTHAGFTGGTYLDWAAVSGVFVAGGDLSGTSTNQQVIGLQGQPFTNTGVAGQVPVLTANLVTFTDPTGCVWDDTRGFLWVSFQSPIVYKVDPTDWTTPVATIDLTPYNTPYTVSSIRIWGQYLLCGTGGGDVNLIDLTTDTVVGWGSTGGSGGTVVAGDDNSQVWIDGSSGAAYYFDLTTLLADFISDPTIPTYGSSVPGSSPIVDLVLGPDSNIWYTQGSSDLIQIDPVAHTTIGIHSEGPPYPNYISLFTAFGSLWAAQGSASPDIVRFDVTGLPDPLSLTATITITEGTVNTPQVFVSDGTEIWVGDSSVVCNLYEIDPAGNTYEGVQNNPDSNSVHALTWNPTDGIMWLAVGYGSGTTKGYVDWTWAGGGTFGTIHTGFNLVDLLWGDAPGVQWWFNNNGDDPVNPRFNDLWLQPDTGNILLYESYGGGTWTSRATVIVSVPDFRPLFSPVADDLPSISSDVTMDQVIWVESRTTTFTVVLSSTVIGQKTTVKDYGHSAAVYNITVIPDSGTIEGSGSFIIDINGMSVDFMFDGANYGIV
jgi:hypothetical protein